MDPRHLIALAFFLFILLVVGLALVHASRDWRHGRRASRSFSRKQKARRAEAARAASEA